MKLNKLFLACGLIIFTATIVQAQQEKGDKVFRFAGNYSKTGDSDGTTMLNVKLGYFFTKNIEAGVEPTFLIGSGFSMVIGSLYGTYNFISPNGKLVPYLGGSVGISYFSFEFPDGSGGTTKTTSTKFSPGGYGGVRYYITEAVNVDSGFAYVLGENDQNTFSWQIGLGIIIGRK